MWEEDDDGHHTQNECRRDTVDSECERRDSPKLLKARKQVILTVDLQQPAIATK